MREPDDATPPEPSSTPGRRERVRRATLQDLKQAALDELRTHGAVGLSLRAVARRMGMSPAGLYRYVASREELLTLLIAEGFDDLAVHLERAHDDAADLGERMRAVALAYRAWAVANPNRFALLFGDPIPGYEAPAEGPTVAAMGRVGAALGAPLMAARAAGVLRVNPVGDPELARGLAPMAELAGEDRELALTLLTAWGRLHGHVILEVFGHHRWLFPDGCAALYRADLEAHLLELGLAGDRPGPAHVGPGGG